jgi:hypothetical protein
MRLVHRRVAVQPRAGHDPIDEVVDHRGDVIDANEAVVQRRGLVGLHCTPQGHADPRAGRRLIRWHAEESAAVRGRRQPSLVSAAGRVNPVVTVVPGSDTQDLSADGDP